MSDKNHSFFPYNPSIGAAIAFAVLFGLSTLLHTFQAWTSRTRYMTTIVVATTMQVIGYTFRSLAIKKQDLFTIYLVSQIMIVVAPAVLAAQVYMVVGRMMSYVGPESTFISHAVITKLFVFVDIICFLTQSAGSAFLFQRDPATHINQLKIGRAVLITGFVFQMGAFCIFALISILFHLKSIQLKGDALRPLRPLFWAFYVMAGLIIIRSIYRTIEFVEFDFAKGAGYLYDYEWPFYTFDTVLIFIATVTLNICHPSRYLPRKKGERMDGTVEVPRKHWWSKASSSAATSQSILMGQRSSSTV